MQQESKNTDKIITKRVQPQKEKEIHVITFKIRLPYSDHPRKYEDQRVAREADKREIRTMMMTMQEKNSRVSELLPEDLLRAFNSSNGRTKDLAKTMFIKTS